MYSTQYIQRFYDSIKTKKCCSYANRGGNIDYSITVPAISDDYFEQVLRLMIKESINRIKEISDLFRIYKVFFNDSERWDKTAASKKRPTTKKSLRNLLAEEY